MVKEKNTKENEISLSKSLCAYLKSGYIEGIGEKTADALYEAFGEDLAETVESRPEQLYQVKGIGKQKIEQICSEWHNHRKVIEIRGWLASIGVSTGYAEKIYDYYGDNAIDILKRDPYQMTLDVPGIGFQTADKIAFGLGVVRAKNDKIRMTSAILAVLQASEDHGNTCCELWGFVWHVKKLLHLDETDQQATKMILGVLKRWMGKEDSQITMVNEEKEGKKRTYVYRKETFFAEHDTAERLAGISRSLRTGRSLSDEEMEGVEQGAGVHFTAEQSDAIRHAVSARLSVITGGPGTGKTQTIAGIIEAFRIKHIPFRLAAPTGKAAERMTEICRKAGSDVEAQTVHRMIGYNPDTYRPVYNHDNLLDTAAVIVDESSMLNIPLTSQLLDAIPLSASIVFVGDNNQLMPVGAGRVFDTLVKCGLFPVTRLTQIMRQKQDSRIVKAAADICAGIVPDLPLDGKSDLCFLPDSDMDDVGEKVIGTARGLIGKYGPEQVVVLTPAKASSTHLNTEALNHACQLAFNPDGQPLPETFSLRGFRVGDRVLQTKNNYKLEVFNGDVGTITGYDEAKKELLVDFVGKGAVQYPVGLMVDLDLAYAMTVHKAQGSEYKGVVMPLCPSHRNVTRRLLNTAITRAKEKMVLVGDASVVTNGVGKDEQDSALCRLLPSMEKMLQKRLTTANV